MEEVNRGGKELPAPRILHVHRIRGVGLLFRSKKLTGLLAELETIEVEPWQGLAVALGYAQGEENLSCVG